VRESAERALLQLKTGLQVDAADRSRRSASVIALQR